MDKFIGKLREWGSRKESTPDLNRSQYSLVSCADLTAGAVQLWMGLPEEVKNDPALAAFKRFYEKEHESSNPEPIARQRTSRSRLPTVNSAPQITTAYPVIINETNILGTSKPVEIPEDDGPEGDRAPTTTTKPREKLSRKYANYVKIASLCGVWVFFTLVFLLFGEDNHQAYKNSYVSPGQVKNLIWNSTQKQVAITVNIQGPFLTETDQEELSNEQLAKAVKLKLWLSPWAGSSEQPPDTTMDIVLDNDALDFEVGETRTVELVSKSANNFKGAYSIHILSTSPDTVPFRMSYKVDNVDKTTCIIVAACLLCGLYTLIIFELINRTMSAIIISTTSIAVLSIVGDRPSIPKIVSWLDIETLLLLFSMMILVAIMAETGLFDYMAVFTFQVTKGKIWPLITLLCTVTAVSSTFLDNVTTVLLTTPITIKLCEVMNLNPIPLLLMMVFFSNVGGTATPVGDPPNVIIASNKEVIASGINFTNFTLHMGLGILLVAVQTFLQMRFMFRDPNKLRLKVPHQVDELRHQINIWKRATESFADLSKDEQIVKKQLKKKVMMLEHELSEEEHNIGKTKMTPETYEQTLADMKLNYKIRNYPLLYKSAFVICFVVLLFFLHAFPTFSRISLGWTALLGAILLLILADREDIEPILHRVEWSTLLFFAALFVFMEVLSELGFISFIGQVTQNLILSVGEGSRLTVALLLILWVSGLASAFIDNIPFTAMMIRVVTSLAVNPKLGLPLAPLIWALSFGACLGGNGTLIGASANVVCAGVAEQHGYKITFKQFFIIGFPIMLGHLVVITFYLLFCHVLFSWHVTP